MTTIEPTTGSQAKSACQRCKDKKLKCDEARPTCGQCRRDKAMDCSTSPIEFKWSRKHEVFGHAQRTPQNRVQKTGQHRKAQRSTPKSNQALSHAQADPSFEVPESSDLGDLDMQLNDSNLPLDVELWRLADMASVMGSQAPQDDFLFADYSSLNQEWSPPEVSSTMDGLSSVMQHNGSALAIDGVMSMNNLSTEQRNSVNEQQNLASQTSARPSTSSLLARFYRLPAPVSDPVISEAYLVRYYFSEVCSLYACFDSDLNAFRSRVADIRSNSASINYSIQSMSIAHLANNHRYMVSLGRSKRSQAWKALQLELRLLRAGKISLDTILMSLLLLGLSSTWHPDCTTGMRYLYIARNLIQGYLQRDASQMLGHARLSDEQFYLESIMYWEMLASFTEPRPMTTPLGNLPPQQAPSSPSSPILPHPWTGIGADVNFILAEIGRLLRRQSVSARLSNDGGRILGDDETDDFHWASSLESSLYTLTIPTEDIIADFGDPQTSRSDLITIAHAQRYVALMELYWAFPLVLKNRLEASNELPFHGTPFSLQPFRAVDSATNSSSLCLTAMAIHVLHILETMSIESGACRLQPLVIISCASQLQVKTTSQNSSDITLESDVTAKALEARFFVEERMLELSRKYPQRNVLQALDIIKEIWEKLDSGGDCERWFAIIQAAGQTIPG